jgi:hypothetical protein
MACSKIFLGDLPELTNEIIQYFRNDFSTLHSCILVNRLWCRLAIPLLWEDPFSKNYPKNYHFIKIYLHKLNKDDKVKLNEYGIINDIFPSDTLFNYPSFIQRLDTRKISNTIKVWVKNFKTLTIEEQPDIFLTKSSNFNQVFKLTSFIFLSIIKIFIENGANLYTFEVEFSNTLEVISIDCFESAFQLILQNPNFICNVKNLNIYFYGLLDDNYIYSLSFLKCFYSNCNSISSLYIHYSIMNDYFEKDLFKVINSQQNLEKIYFGDGTYPLKNLKIYNCSNTLKTIIFHKTNLNDWGINFNEVFEHLNVLESIHILYCYPINSTIIQQINNLTKPFKLKSLFMDHRSILLIESLKLLLEKSGNYLENIGFNSSIGSEYKLQLFKLLKIYCTKIKFINLLGFNEQNIFLALDLIENIKQNLNYLAINFCQFGYYQSSNDDKFSSIILQNLGQILPNRLEYLSLALKINVNDLKVFFKNSQNTFIRKLLIRNKLYQDDKSMILPCIKKYIMEEKRVTYLAIENVPAFSDGERKNLLKEEVEEFKFYGIQVADYDNLCIRVCDLINELY